MVAASLGLEPSGRLKCPSCRLEGPNSGIKVSGEVCGRMKGASWFLACWRMREDWRVAQRMSMFGRWCVREDGVYGVGGVSGGQRMGDLAG